MIHKVDRVYLFLKSGLFIFDADPEMWILSKFKKDLTLKINVDDVNHQ